MEDSCLPLPLTMEPAQKIQQTEQTQHGLSDRQPGGRLGPTVDHGEAFALLLHEPCGGASYPQGAVAGVFISLKFVFFFSKYSSLVTKLHHHTSHRLWGWNSGCALTE